MGRRAGDGRGVSGALDDGAIGAALIHRAGGTVFVQDPDDALFAGIPRATLSAVPTATVLPAAALPAALSDAIRSAGPPQEIEPDDRRGATEMSMARSGDPLFLSDDESRLTRRLVCPDCHGGLAQVDLSHITYYRCSRATCAGEPRTTDEHRPRSTDVAVHAPVASTGDRQRGRGP